MYKKLSDKQLFALKNKRLEDGYLKIRIIGIKEAKIGKNDFTFLIYDVQRETPREHKKYLIERMQLGSLQTRAVWIHQDEFESAEDTDYLNRLIVTAK